MAVIAGEASAIGVGTLYLVATPIGNMADISQRASLVLGEVDLIAAEDTREARKVMAHLGIKKRCISYHEHNRAAQTGRIVALLQAGKSVALISDAGMPCICDPGTELITQLQNLGLPYTVIPGPSAVLSALALSGMPASRFVFEGFLPHKGVERQKRLRSLQSEERTIVIYEAPHRIRRTLKDLVDILGQDRLVCLAREMTKLFEEALVMSLQELLEHCLANQVRGEIVLVIRGAEEPELPPDSPKLAIDIYHKLLDEGNSRQEAMRGAVRQSGIARDELYKLLWGQKE